MMGRSWGAALTTGLVAGALGLVCLLGAVLHSTALPLKTAVSWKDGNAAQPQPAAPARTREANPDNKAGPERQPKPPGRLWRGPSFEKHPPKPRKALA